MTKKEYLTRMVEECLDVQVNKYDSSQHPARLWVRLGHSYGGWTGAFRDLFVWVQLRSNQVIIDLRSTNLKGHPEAGKGFDPEDAQKLKDWMTKRGAKVQNTVNSNNRIVFKCKEYPWQCYTEPKAEEQPEPFEPGTKVRFTQEAKERFDDTIYWHYANGSDVEKNLNVTFTVKSYSSKDWPGYRLKPYSGMSPYMFADYLLEEVPEEKAKPEPKREVAEIIRLREENKELKAKIQDLEDKLKDQKELKQGKIYINPSLAGTGFTVRFDL